VTVADRVADGVAVLDEMRPGWANVVDIDTLEMSYASMCILGHVYGSFDAGCMMLYGRHAGESEAEGLHGFAQVHVDEDWAPIQAEWVRIVSARQATDPVLSMEYVDEVALD
jgi:hypothetical protein